MRQFSRAAQEFAKDAAGGAKVEKLRRDFPAVATRWQDVSALVGSRRTFPRRCADQTARVDGLDRQLTTMLLPDGLASKPTRPTKVSVLAVGADAGDGAARRGAG